MWSSCADGERVRDILPKPHALPLVRQDVSDPPAGGVRHIELEELVLEQSREDGVERRAEVHKQDPGVGSRGVQMRQDEVEGHRLMASSIDLLDPDRSVAPGPGALRVFCLLYCFRTSCS